MYNNKYFKTGCFTVIMIVVGMIIVLCCFVYNNSTKSNTTNNEIERFSLSKDIAGYNEGNAFYIVGGIRNNLDKQYSYVQVTFNLYNKDGAQIGTAMDNINNFEPNGIWKFKAIGIIGEKVDTYKLTGITGW